MANTAAAMINVLVAENGYREGANNYTKYAPQVPGLEWAQNEAWCQVFISWGAVKSGNRDIIPLTASCSTCTDWFESRGQLYQTPKPGDLVMYGPGGGSHVELVVAVESSRIKTVGGNTNNDGSANGNGVYVKYVNRSSTRIYGYCRPKYKDGPAGAVSAAGAGAAGTASKYTVKSGQTLSGIAALLGVSLAALLAVNSQIGNPDLIHPGQQINVPSKPPTQAPSVKPSTPPKPPASTTPKAPVKPASVEPEHPTVRPSKVPAVTHVKAPADSVKPVKQVSVDPPKQEPSTVVVPVKPGDTIHDVAGQTDHCPCQIAHWNPGLADHEHQEHGHVPVKVRPGRHSKPERPIKHKYEEKRDQEQGQVHEELKEIKTQLSHISDQLKTIQGEAHA
ncbi:LysM peptidoglycan-binding domain-containing protein [Streptomyces sp. BI20]|uniref:LysM peptidoglycan-binding domain-containing protein n=1 Tax=Streptomyces sp. BI20 TaxID=3403460 RepID=UPI003C72A688